ncbi:hypothetical protein RM572_21195 [Streptomyces sp. DSM 42041]|uniref:Uncharacterized protein n=1 Tax=Streptomyces hazeniae TaxID=3075538 RepID=A0ABU2NXM7_9ACTN|nr:hypothetical protein [Streptomyces sp. DSM 42041]MDT0381277.1 hypothetical protein [Streptomyces sp. DSM 42041]
MTVAPARASGVRRNGGAPGVWAPVLANLLLGVLAVAPLWCLQWLLVVYPAVDCGGGVGCDKEAGGDALGAAIGALVGGVIVLGLLLVVDVLMPRQERWPVHHWLGAAVLIPLPYVAGQAMGLL